LLDVVWDAHSPLVLCQQSLASMLSDPRGPSAPTRHVLNHYGFSLPDLEHDARTILASASAQLGWRLLAYLNFPLIFVRLVHPAITQAMAEALVKSLFDDLSECCLGDEFSLKVRRFFVDASALLGSKPFMRILRLWAKATKTTNMHLERMLSELKHHIRDAGTSSSLVKHPGLQAEECCYVSRTQVASP
jgi:hypothetical protein